MGRYLWLPPLCFDVGSIAFGAFASHRDREDRAAGKGRRQHTALVVLATSIFTLGVAIPWATTVWQMVFMAGAALVGGGALYALLTADMLARVPAHLVSTAGGLTAAAQSLAYIVANIAIGAIVQRTHSYASVAITLSLLALPGTLFWLTRDVNDSRPAAIV
jgi:MFS family permease